MNKKPAAKLWRSLAAITATLLHPMIALRRLAVKLLPRHCEICGERIHRDQLTSAVGIAHLGERGLAHRYCSPWERRRAAAVWN